MTAPLTRRLIPLVGFTLLLIACASTAPPPPVVALTIVPVTTELVVGATVQLTAATWDASGRAVGHRAVTWASSNPTVGIVSATGLVTALNRGSTTVTVTCEDRRATAVVIVFLPMGV